MKPQTRNNLLILIAIIAAGILFIHARQTLTTLNTAETSHMEKEHELYLPDASYLKYISMGHDGLIADLVLAKTLTYYGSHYSQRETFKFKHLRKLFFTAVEMDPLNKEAFLLANNTLKDVNINDAMGILKRGMKHHPQYWKFPEMIGFNYFYNLNDYHNAAKYYELAAQMPDHPPYVPSLSGKFYQESGRYEDALRVLYNFYGTTEDKLMKNSFKESILAVEEKIRKQRFRLQGTVTEIIDAATIRFRRDPDNPQFKYLKPVETLRVTGLKPIETGTGKKERLFAYFQKDYAAHVLNNAQITLRFERHHNGRIRRDKYDRLRGTIIFKSRRLYQVDAVEKGYIEANYKGTFNTDLKKQLREAEATAREKKRGLYREQPELIRAKEVHLRTGRIITVDFPVYNVEIAPDKITLTAAAHYRSFFKVVIPGDAIKTISPKGPAYFKNLKNKWIRVTGYVGVNKIAEIKIHHPSQLILKTLTGKPMTTQVQRPLRRGSKGSLPLALGEPSESPRRAPGGPPEAQQK